MPLEQPGGAIWEEEERVIAGRLFALALFCIVAAAPAEAETVKLGLLKTTSSAVAVIAIQRGYFADVNLDAQLVPFDAAEPVAVAVASNDIDFAITGLTAGLYALGSQLRIISGHLQEHPGFHANAIVASNKAYAAGLTSIKDLAGHSVGVTQIGSSLHYSVALVAEKSGIALDSLRIVPLQSNANVASAVSGGQIDAAATLGNFASPAVAKGTVKLLAWAGDIAPWQFGALITSVKEADQHPDTVTRFLAAMHRAQRDYHDAFTAPDGTRHDEPGAAAIFRILSNFLGQTREQMEPALAYVDGQGRLDVEDVLHQIDWYRAHGFLKNTVDGSKLIDKRFVVPMSLRGAG
ncbi:MAG TPA: ABC transporter substrate-binding protein [Stellaceae bacterium]|nr:ABC transporter substrate-binding protein [Stellaceae bacterium]